MRITVSVEVEGAETPSALVKQLATAQALLTDEAEVVLTGEQSGSITETFESVESLVDVLNEKLGDDE